MKKSEFKVNYINIITMHFQTEEIQQIINHLIDFNSNLRDTPPNEIFNKGIDRKHVFIKYLGREFNSRYEGVTSAAAFLVSNQVFGDGNHRTSVELVHYMGYQLDKHDLKLIMNQVMCNAFEWYQFSYACTGKPVDWVSISKPIREYLDTYRSPYSSTCNA
uniref:Uncharacterized protein n=1 Tax=Megaviridae environmental sample TaxID=1737588 RepID=A0A5J6VI61_9VIRU|nr:MAG: hypothetical protein [Megaviridae environmental sample]